LLSFNDFGVLLITARISDLKTEDPSPAAFSGACGNAFGKSVLISGSDARRDLLSRAQAARLSSFVSAILPDNFNLLSVRSTANVSSLTRFRNSCR